MKINKSINIYMGIIGEAYVDKESAKVKFLDAQKNVKDAQAIETAVNELDAPLTEAISNAENAQTAAEHVYELLVNAINNETSISKKEKLNKLLDLLNEDSLEHEHASNCNIYVAGNNLGLLTTLKEEEFEDIKAKVQELLDNNRLNEIVRFKEWNDAIETFESMVPVNAITPEKISDTVESELLARINALINNINSGEIISAEIIAISEQVEALIEEIQNGEDEGEDEEPIITENYLWYAGNIKPTDVEGVEGIDSPLMANKWFNIPSSLATDKAIIAGVDGGKTGAAYWYAALPLEYEFAPVKPTGVDDETVIDDSWEQDDTIIVNGKEYQIWKTDVNVYNRQRLNVYFACDVEWEEPKPKFVFNVTPIESADELPNIINVNNINKPTKKQTVDMNEILSTSTVLQLIYPLAWETNENGNIVKPIIKDPNNFEVGIIENETTPVFTYNGIEFRNAVVELGKAVYTIEF